MRAVVERVQGETLTCSLIGYPCAPIYLSIQKLQKPLAEGSAIVYYESKWFSNIKHQTERKRLTRKLVDDAFA